MRTTARRASSRAQQVGPGRFREPAYTAPDIQLPARVEGPRVEVLGGIHGVRHRGGPVNLGKPLPACRGRSHSPGGREPSG